MRRSDREVTDRHEIEAILREARVCRIALADGNGPYLVPICFGYDNGVLYLHSAREASKNLSGSSCVSSPGDPTGRRSR